MPPRNLARAQTWETPTPAEILAIANDASLNLIRNGDELLEVLIESLTVWQHQLHGETPSIMNLWDYQVQTKTYRPRDEPHLSDCIKQHLEMDIGHRGVFLGREVENSAEPSTPPRSEHRYLCCCLSARGKRYRRRQNNGDY